MKAKIEYSINNSMDVIQKVRMDFAFIEDCNDELKSEIAKKHIIAYCNDEKIHRKAEYILKKLKYLKN